MSEKTQEKLGLKVQGGSEEGFECGTVSAESSYREHGEMMPGW